MGELRTELHHYKKKSARLEEELMFRSMEAEDYHSTIVRNEYFLKNFNEIVKDLKYTIEDKDKEIKKKEGAIKGRDSEIDRLKEALLGGADKVAELTAKVEELELQIIEG